jgi:hypothetical protein
VVFRRGGEWRAIDGTDTELLASGPRTRRWSRELAQIADWEWPDGVEFSGVIVMTPLRRRLFRAGDGVLFLSDRAFRVTPGLERYHRAPVARGWLAATLPTPDGWDRAFAADTLVRDVLERTPDITRPLKWLAWHPLVDAFLYDGTTPFFSDLMREPWPSDPLPDALDERYRREVPGGVAARWVDDGYGLGTSRDAALAWLENPSASLSTQLLRQGVDADWLRSLRTTRPDHAFALTVEGRSVRVERAAAASAPSVPVVVRVDGVDRIWFSATGDDALSIELPEAPQEVQIDPNRHLGQSDLSDDHWPLRWTMVLVSGFSSIDLSEMDGNGEAALIMRPAHDSRFVAYIDVFRDEQAEGGVKFLAGRYMGKSVDRRLREHRLYGWVGTEWLRADLLPPDVYPLAWTTGLSWVWDTRVDWRFPFEGHSLSFAAEIGRLPAGAVGWRSGEASFALVHAVHPRLAFAMGLGAGVAGGDLPSGWLRLGGTENLRSISSDWVVGRALQTGSVEARMVPFRHGNVPVIWGWWTELELALALEYGVLADARFVEDLGLSTEPIQVLGAAVEAFVGVDVLGVRPGRMGIGYARPLEVSAPREPAAERLYLTYLHAF